MPSAGVTPGGIQVTPCESAPAWVGGSLSGSVRMSPCEGRDRMAWTRIGLGYEWAWACAGVGASDLGGVILNERESERKRA